MLTSYKTTAHLSRTTGGSTAVNPMYGGSTASASGSSARGSAKAESISTSSVSSVSIGADASGAAASAKLAAAITASVGDGSSAIASLGGHLITKNKVEGQMAIWTRKNGMAVKSYLAVKKPVRP